MNSDKGIPLVRFLQKFRICGPFRVHLIVNILEIHSTYSREIVFFSAKFLSPPSGETIVRCQSLWRRENGTDVLYHYAKYDGFGTLHALGASKQFIVLNFFCLSVMLTNGKFCNPIIEIDKDQSLGCFHGVYAQEYLK